MSSDRDWHEAADAARFTFFEPTGPGRTHVWAGGHGGGPHEPSNIGILALIDGLEVRVETSIPNPRLDADLSRRLIVVDVMHSYVFSGRGEITPPVSITVLPDDRTIALAGRSQVFSGVRIDGDDRWIGEAERDGLLVRVTVPTGMPDFAIEPCHDWAAMPPYPPPGR